MDGDLTLGGECMMQYAGGVSQSYTLETRIILFKNIFKTKKISKSTDIYVLFLKAHFY